MARVDAFMLSNFRHGLSDLKQDLLVYFNLVLHTHLLVYPKCKFGCHWLVTTKHFHLQLSVSFRSNFVLCFVKTVSLERICI